MELRLEGIGRTVGAETWLHPMDLALRPGTVTVLLGATQAGKTSLMRIMAGLDRPDRGRVRVDGQDVTGLPVRDRNVAMVYQQFINYPSMTVRDNIASPLKLHRTPKATIDKKVRELAERLHIDIFLDRLPAELSGGQQQRVALARALILSPKIVVADEALSTLDISVRSQIINLLLEMQETMGLSYVLVANDLGIVSHISDEVLVMHEGRVVERGKTLKVFADPQHEVTRRLIQNYNNEYRK